MSYPIENLPLKTRVTIYAVLLLLALGIHYFTEGSSFWRGFAAGLLLAVIPGELFLYLRRRKAKQNQNSPV
jgi:hypothetical protein